MRIDAVKSSKNYQYTYPINFRGKTSPWIKNAVFPDIFTHSTAKTPVDVADMNLKFEHSINKIMKKIDAQIDEFTPEKLEKSIIDVRTAIPNASEENILKTMQRLTQWADYNCFETIGRKFKSEKIHVVSTQENVNGKTKVFGYFQRKKQLFPVYECGTKRAYMITKGEPVSVPSKDFVFVHLEGFDDGINLFSDNDRLSEVTINTIRKVHAYQEKNGTSFSDTLDEVLNGQVRKDFEGQDLVIVRRSASPTREGILMQMRSLKPSRNELKDIIDATAQYFSKGGEHYLELRNNIANFYVEKAEIFSKQRVVKGLQELNTRIKKFQNKHDIDNIYLLSSNFDNEPKSFDVMEYMFKNIGKNSEIPAVKMKSITEVNALPEKSMFLILDDMICSGDTMVNTFNYENVAHRIKGDTRHIIFASIASMPKGYDEVESAINRVRREKFDRIISVNDLKRVKSSKEIKLEEYFCETEVGKDAYGFEGISNGQGCLTFPYMAPDTNADLSSFLLKFFVPSNHALKCEHLALRDIELFCK